MPLYLTADGGGTKLQCILFDEQLRVLGRGQSGGTNTNFIPLSDVRMHMETCVDECLNGYRGELETVWATIVGPAELLEEILAARLTVRRFVRHGEGIAYLLAGALSDHGCVALAGTGSGAVYINGDRTVHFGGFGLVIGDDGSGWWIGSRGVNAVIRELEGWGPPTALTRRLFDYLDIETQDQIINAIYRGPRDARSMAAGFCGNVGAAADEGDCVALGIIREAAELLALQMRGLFRRTGIDPSTPVTACGGAWKSTPLLLRHFAETLHEEVPAPVAPALFSPVIHGAVALLLEQGRRPVDYLPVLERNFADYRV